MGKITDTGAATSVANDATLRVQQVRQLQDDLHVLMGHLASQPNMDGPPSWTRTTARARVSPAAETAPAANCEAGLLAVEPDVIAGDQRLLGQLYNAIGELARLAAPADVTSIRLTQAFVRGDEAVRAPAYIAREARRLRRWAWISAAFGLLIFTVTMLLLIHLDRGRRIVQQLKALDLEQTAAMSDLLVGRLASAERGVETDPDGCEVQQHGAAGTGLGQSAQQHYILCQRLVRVQYNLQIIRHQLQIWNLTSDRLAMVSPVSWIAPRPALPADVSEQSWQSSELRTAVLMTAMSDVVLPMLLGLLGACVYVYREIDNSIQTCTLAAREGMHGTLRMLLGGILGGLTGLLWSNGQVVNLEGASLSLGAMAFFVGFSVEVVFRITDAAVQAVADRIGKPRA